MAAIEGYRGIQLPNIHKSTPWYLNPTYSDPNHIIITQAGAVRGGTLPMLVEHLTIHDNLDSAFVHSFLLTYKSFTTIKELLQLLIKRFNISPPNELTQQELEEWAEKKQKVVRAR